MSNMPDRIWASACARKVWESEDEKMDADVEYVRADIVEEQLQELEERRQADADASDPLRNIIW